MVLQYSFTTVTSKFVVEFWRLTISAKAISLFSRVGWVVLGQHTPLQTSGIQDQRTIPCFRQVLIRYGHVMEIILAWFRFPGKNVHRSSFVSCRTLFTPRVIYIACSICRCCSNYIVHLYLYEAKFKLYIDQKSLKCIYSTKIPATATHTQTHTHTHIYIYIYIYSRPEPYQGRIHTVANAARAIVRNFKKYVN